MNDKNNLNEIRDLFKLYTYFNGEGDVRDL